MGDQQPCVHPSDGREDEEPLYWFRRELKQEIHRHKSTTLPFCFRVEVLQRTTRRLSAGTLQRRLREKKYAYVPLATLFADGQV
jgi:hypothetical protein